MAKDTSRRPTKRQKGAIGPVTPAPSSFGAPEKRFRVVGGGASAPKAAPASKATKAAAPAPKAPKTPKVGAPTRRASAPAGASTPRSSRPAFLDKVARRPATDRPATGREERQRHQRVVTLKLVARVAAGLVALAVVALVAFIILRNSSAFAIENVEVEPTTHVTEDDLQKLVQVPAGSTLLNMDTSSIEKTLKTDPWVGSVTFERVFPHTLKLTINEQKPDALVVMSSGSVAWYLGDAGSWIQPTKLTPAEGQSVNDAALAIALSEGALLVTDVPATVQPAAGAPATDDALAAVQTFRKGFSESFSSQVVSYSAPSADNVSCTLSSGIQVELGRAENIEQKESIVSGYLNQYGAGELLIINVRVVSNPGVRPVGSDQIQGGSGVTAPSGEGEQTGEGAGMPAEGEPAVEGQDGTQDGTQDPEPSSDSGAPTADA